ncbi:hypothetical protein [Granulosicoccus antarcticus]|uniref:hypothetical protein n=1 Tax=Granulosicoccus antarcticus TaxID=437505 RepID=UPI0012FE7524|nr:hypothetical protein [Granulosicoccus antarcticus]
MGRGCQSLTARGWEIRSGCPVEEEPEHQADEGGGISQHDDPDSPPAGGFWAAISVIQAGPVTRMH